MQFFLRGTQLAQLSEEYSTCLENINQTTKVLHHKGEAIPDLEDALTEATARFDEAKKAREQQRRVLELKRELAWAHVATKQAEYEAKMTDQAKSERTEQKIEQALADTEVWFDSFGTAWVGMTDIVWFM